MKALIKRELTLNWKWYNYAFFAMPLLLLIPNYPLCVGMLYFLFFVTTLFPSFGANREYEFLMTLPVSRKQIVAVRFFDVVFGQTGTILVAIPLLILDALFVKPNGNTLCDPNLTFVGITCIEYGVFLLIFFPLYFKNLKMTNPLLLALLGYTMTTALFETLIQVIQPVRAVLDSLDPACLLLQIPVLVFGVLFYIFSMVTAYKKSVKVFDSYNL